MNCPDDQVYKRLLDIEELCKNYRFTFTVFSKRIENTENIAPKVDENKKSLDGLAAKVINEANKSQETLGALSQLRADHYRSTQDFMDQLTKKSSEIELLKSKVNSLEDGLKKCLDSYQKLQDSHSGLKTRIEDLDDTVLKHSILHEDKDIDLMSLEQQSKNADTLLVALSKFTQSIFQSLEVTKLEIEHLKSVNIPSLADFHKKIDALRNDFNNIVSTQVRGLLDQMPKPVEKNLDEVSSILSKKVDQFVLDVSNASLRSQNNEAQIKQLQKQIENLSLLIKKLELKG